MDNETNVKIYEPRDYDKVMRFLQGIDTLQEIEEELFPNAVLIESGDEILGMITYEIFRRKALIRYFIFDKDVNESLIVAMYEKFFENLQKQKIKSVYVIINNVNLKAIFDNLGFTEFPKENFYLTEENIANTKYKDAIVMVYQLDD